MPLTPVFFFFFGICHCPMPLVCAAGVCIKSSAGFGEVANILVRNTTIRSKYGPGREAHNNRARCRGCNFKTISSCPACVRADRLPSSLGPTPMRTATTWSSPTLPYGTPTGGWAFSSGAPVGHPPTPHCTSHPCPNTTTLTPCCDMAGPMEACTMCCMRTYLSPPGSTPYCGGALAR